ncbi:1-acylglycerol-3-phosphate O-acyltransferase [Cladochytrium tenue]|nr:1-acylglycerol-3-phosphate O-acyltransferase [Cladochytrium tenue]
MASSSTTAWLAVAALTVVAFRASRRVRFYVRMLLFMFTIALASLLGLFSVPYLATTGKLRDANSYIAAYFRILARWLLNATVRVDGREHLTPERPAVFLVNHQSEMDMVVMANIIPKDTVILNTKHVRNRGDRKSAIETMGQVAKKMEEQKVALYIFPEGTRSYQTTNEMLPLKKGAFHLAVQGQMPIIPIVAASYNDAYCLREGLFESGELKVKVLPPIPTKGLGLDDVNDLLEKTQDLMQTTLAEISGPLPPYAKPMKKKSQAKSQ